MRMRKKKNLVPRQQKCNNVFIREPMPFRGKWLEDRVETEVHIEIGCGKGNFTVQTADALRNVLHIGIERVPEAMLIAMERAVNLALTNLLFVDLDAASLADIFAPSEVDRIYLNFSDPWKPPRQAKRRLTSPNFLQIYQHILKPGGEIHIKTDNTVLFAYSKRTLTDHGFDLHEVTDDLHKHGIHGFLTDYEQRFIQQGMHIHRLVARWNGRDNT